uniref:Uncharacterized protein n=1 Tax=Arundo donax TaxID=35708 RepID=A0A0A9A0Z3_ARUDO
MKLGVTEFLKLQQHYAPGPSLATTDSTIQHLGRGNRPAIHRFSRYIVHSTCIRITLLA